MNQVITISREYGSGGRELGVRLAKALGIPFYDKEVISMAADDMEIAGGGVPRRRRRRSEDMTSRSRFPII